MTFWRNSLNNWVTSCQIDQTVKYDCWQIPEETRAAGDVRTDPESNETTWRVPEQFAVDRNLQKSSGNRKQNCYLWPQNRFTSFSSCISWKWADCPSSEIWAAKAKRALLKKNRVVPTPARLAATVSDVTVAFAVCGKWPQSLQTLITPLFV